VYDYRPVSLDRDGQFLPFRRTDDLVVEFDHEA
jgi:hypothetical protein